MAIDLLFLNDKEMNEAGAGDMSSVIHDVERAYTLYAEGDACMPGKIVLPFGPRPEDEYTLGRINCMPGRVGGEYNIAGVKWVGSAPDNATRGLPRATATIILNDTVTKLPVCVCDGTEVSAMRTGASGGVAMKYLARENARVITICGAGVQGRTQLRAAVCVRPSIEKVYVYDLRYEASLKFIEEMRFLFPALEFVPVTKEALPDACRESDIVDTATLAQEPFVMGEWLKPGSLAVNMAGYEMDQTCVERASKVVVDFWETVKHRLHATVAHMAEEGKFADADLYAEINELCSGRKPGRTSEEEIIYFNAVGAGILDLAVAARCYHNAAREGKGTRVSYWA